MISTRFKKVMKELAETKGPIYSQTMQYILKHISSNYNTALNHLLNVLQEAGNSYELKTWHVKYLSAMPDIKIEILEEEMEASTEEEQFRGTFQNNEVSESSLFEASYMLVNFLKFTVPAADELYTQLQSLTDITGGEVEVIRNFIDLEIPVLIQSILSRMIDNDIKAKAAHEIILHEMSPAPATTYTLSKLLISDQMSQRLDQIARDPDAINIILSEIKAAQAILNTQMKNRAQRCKVSLKCSGEIKSKAYTHASIIQLLDKTFIQCADRQKMDALEGSIAIDQYSCHNEPNMDFDDVFDNVGKLEHHLGFFAPAAMKAENVSLDREKPPTFKTFFNSLLTQLVSTCSSEQFLSMAAIGLLLPTVNNTVAALTGYETNEMMRLGM